MTTLTIKTLEPVRAVHDIMRNRHTVVKCGSPGKVLDCRSNSSSTTYDVEFNSVRGATVTLSGLTEGDIEPA